MQFVAKFFTRDKLVYFSLICYSLSVPTGYFTQIGEFLIIYSDWWLTLHILLLSDYICPQKGLQWWQVCRNQVHIFYFTYKCDFGIFFEFSFVFVTNIYFMRFPTISCIFFPNWFTNFRIKKKCLCLIHSSLQPLWWNLTLDTLVLHAHPDMLLMSAFGDSKMMYSVWSYF